jgi:ATP-dependent DNA helicase RecG
LTNEADAGKLPASTKWWDFFRQKLREGRQGYVITPLIDDGGASGVASVQAEFESLANGELADFRLDLVHGRMSAAEKEAAMDAFRRGQTQVLVATSVVEVGVDVPNATVMTIEDGQRFGLAQLHQLRGRVSRGTQPGYVCVLAACDTEDSTKRLEAFASTGDGFELAELDFQLRGPGDLLGTRQHGMPPLRIADLQRDTSELESARRDAQALVDDQQRWHSPAFARLRQMVFRRYGQTLELGDVG